MIAWWKELRRRWPAIEGVLRGKTVVYNLHTTPPLEVLTAPSAGCVLMDTFVDGRDPWAELIHAEQRDGVDHER